MTTTDSALAVEPAPPQKILIIDAAKSSRDKAAAMVVAVGHTPVPVADAFEGHAEVDGAAAVLASHPAAAPIYPRLRDAGIPLILSFPPRQARPSEAASLIGCDAFVVRPYRRDTMSIALYAAFGARLLRERAVRAELALAEMTGVLRQSDQAGLLHADVFKTLLPLEIRRARRHNYPIAICVVQLDPLPNAVPITPALVNATEPFLRSAVRDVDLAVRYGEGRFLVFLPHTDATGARTVGDRIVTGMRACRFRSGGVTLMVTASVGIASLRPGKSISFAKLIRDAHAAVKAAQLKGGDQAILR
jgi:PleD family two-component response regulator